VLEELADRYGPVTDSARGLVDISLLRVVAAGLGIYEVTQQKDTLILYSDKLDPAALKPLLRDRELPVMFNASSKPYLAVRIGPGQRPLDLLNRTISALAQTEAREQ